MSFKLFLQMSQYADALDNLPLLETPEKTKIALESRRKEVDDVGRWYNRYLYFDESYREQGIAEDERMSMDDLMFKRWKDCKTYNIGDVADVGDPTMFQVFPNSVERFSSWLDQDDVKEVFVKESAKKFSYVEDLAEDLFRTYICKIHGCKFFKTKRIAMTYSKLLKMY